MTQYARAEERLVKFLTEDWRRRGTQLLQVGLHSPILPEFFWDCGFDVTVCEERQDAVTASLERSGPRISYQIGKADYLPFDDDSFEYAFFSLYADKNYIRDFNGCSCIEPDFFREKVFSELCRVSRRGVVIVAKNRFSLFRSAHRGAGFNPYSLWKAGRTYCPCGRVKFASTGFLPRVFAGKFEFANSAVSYLPFGALIGCGLEFNAPPVTGIGAFIKKEQRKLEQVSCIQRNT